MRFERAVVFVVALVLIACGGAGDSPQGEVGGHCYPNGTCNVGLDCVGGVCVAGSDAGLPDAGTDAGTDAGVCGDGVVDTAQGETCDIGIASGTGACPASCNDNQACTADALTGSQCTATCTFTSIGVPANGDGCCPAGANANTDSDCAPSCGNSVHETGETCDTGIASGLGACPNTCSDTDVCTVDALTNAGTCQAACTLTPITVAASGDGCCPSGANANTDSDCVPDCGNAVVELGEACDDANTNNADGCDELCFATDLSCMGNAAPTTAPPAIVLAGSVIDRTTTSTPPLAGATVQTCTDNCSGPSLLDTQVTSASGAFTTSSLATGGTPFDAHLRVSKVNYRSTYAFPDSPWATSTANLALFATSDAVFATIVALSGQTQSAANGTVAIAVLDCAGAALDNTANVTISVTQSGSAVGGAAVMIAGTYVVFDVPPGPTVINASYYGNVFRAHTVLVAAGTTTYSAVKPGYAVTPSVQVVQADSMPAGSPVDLDGVVVTAVDAFGQRTGDIWVQDAAGGVRSGVRVFGVPAGTVGTLGAGDVINIRGAEKAEFALPQDTSGRTETILQPVASGMTVTKVGTTTPPPPVVVDAVAIGQLATQAARDDEWEKWEGVQITVNDVRAFSAPAVVGGGDATYEQFSLTGPLRADSGLAAFPASIVPNACLASITGIGGYFFNHLIVPRSTQDVVTGGTGCVPAESGTTACRDAIDNDANGFSDCADDACIVSDPTCRTVTTITALQTSALPTGAVEVQDVYVTAVSADGTNMWVASNANAAPNAGIFVHGNGALLGGGITPGTRVTVIGRPLEFNDVSGTGSLTEIERLSITVTGGPATIVPVSGQTAASLVVDVTGEPYESVLVTLTNVRVVSTGTPSQYVGQLTQSGTSFPSDDDIYRLPGTELDACYASISGIWTYNVFANAWRFLPIGPGTAGGTCP